MSRISMNDIFVATFIVAAYALFWQIWSGRWARSAWWVLPLVGVLIGLAAASKWVGWYALAGLIVLVLAGRLSAGSCWWRGSPSSRSSPASALRGPSSSSAHGPGARPAVSLGGKPIRLVPEALVGAPGRSRSWGRGSASRSSSPDPQSRDGSRGRGVRSSPSWPAARRGGMARLDHAGGGGPSAGWRAFGSLRDPAADGRWYRPGEMAGFAWPWVGACLVMCRCWSTASPTSPTCSSATGSRQDWRPGYSWSLDELHAQMFGYHFTCPRATPRVAVVELAAGPEADLVLQQLTTAARSR